MKPDQQKILSSLVRLKRQQAEQALREVACHIAVNAQTVRALQSDLDALSSGDEELGFRREALQHGYADEVIKRLRSLASERLALQAELNVARLALQRAVRSEEQLKASPAQARQLR